MKFVSKHDGKGQLEGFYFEGPYTEFPEWFLDMEKEGKVSYSAKCVYLKDPAVRGYQAQAKAKEGKWVCRYHNGSQLYFFTTEDLRSSYAPVGDGVREDYDAYVEEQKNTVVTLIRPVRYYEYVWTGHCHRVPNWLYTAMTEGRVQVRGRKLMIGTLEVLPGDYVVMQCHDERGVLNAFSPDDYALFKEGKR
ncbi:MAG: hypothetical protein DI616_15920 [Paracoccus denitrificans]|uniref:Uncharacterized protein n=1 Tax=Paracoccus denitrificans TaxID=266 RepID=A0A533I4B7_PARDE|nr:MAG: hypothetical protein DI616_15920 [Paracoccus denitrificans]